jgi:hypothetical protein
MGMGLSFEQDSHGDDEICALGHWAFSPKTEWRFAEYRPDIKPSGAMTT